MVGSCFVLIVLTRYNNALLKTTKSCNQANLNGQTVPSEELESDMRQFYRTSFLMVVVNSLGGSLVVSWFPEGV